MSQFNPNATEQQSFDQDLVPTGVHAARCARVIEIGEQHSPRFDVEDPDTGEIKKSIYDKAVIVLSLSNLTYDFKGLGEKQRFISKGFGITIGNSERGNMKEYTRALDPDGQATCLGDFIGRGCQVSVVHKTKNEKTRADIDSVAPVLPGTEIPPLDTEPFWFEFDNPNGDLWVLIPEFTQNLVKAAVNYPGSLVEQMVLAIEGEIAATAISVDDSPI